MRGSRPPRPGLCFAIMLRPTQSSGSESQLPSSRSGAVAGAKFQTRCRASGTLRSAERSLTRSAASSLPFVSRVRPGCWQREGSPESVSPAPRVPRSVHGKARAGMFAAAT